MIISNIKKGALIFGLTLLPITAVGLSYVANNASNFRLTKASAHTVVLDDSNAPSLSGTSGTMVDDKNVTWEYSNASVYDSGHITINPTGYFGISSSSVYGYTGIDGVTADFSQGELWLLVSIDGINWNEGEELTSGVESAAANNWRYIRFYSHVDTISINSVSIGYSCTGVTASEDVDGAHVENVIQVSDTLTYEKETTEVSPLGNSTEAVKFTKSGNKSTTIIISLGLTYLVKDIAYKNIEFDIKGNINYGKTLQLMKDTATVGSTIESSKHSSYIVTDLGNDWHHVKVPVTALLSLISGYDKQDIPTKNLENREVNAIKINAGGCILDNLRVSSSAPAIGRYNNGTSFSVGSVYWYKVSWTGKLHSCVITFDDPIAEQVPVDDPLVKNGSPFYIRGLSAGTTTATATLVIGYNHQTYTFSGEITIN